jgi:hypothetical protein
MLSARERLYRRIGDGSLGALLLEIATRHAATPDEPVKNFLFRAAEEGDEDARLIIQSGILGQGTDP